MTESKTWKRRYYILFYKRLKELYAYTLKLKEQDPENYHHNAIAKLFAHVIKAIESISQDPTDSRYILGKSLGPKHKDWRRDKHDVPPRYRLFFKFFSSEKEIIFAWLNDAQTLRKEGSKSDPYVLFKRMLDRYEVPSDKEKLKENSHNQEPWK